MTSWIFLKFSKHNRQVIEPSFCFVIFITLIFSGPLGVIVIFMDFSPICFKVVGVEFGFVDEVVATWFIGFHFEELCKKNFPLESKVLYSLHVL